MIGVWIVVWAFTKGQHTLDLPGREHTDLHDSLTEFRNGIIAGRDNNPVMQVTNAIAEAFRSIVDWFQRMVARPNFPRPVPQIGWLGVTAVATWIGLRRRQLADRHAGAVLVPLLRAFGFWEDSIDLLIVTAVSVVIVLVVGMPLAVLFGTKDWAARILTPSWTSCRRCRPSSTCCRSCSSSASASAAPSCAPSSTRCRR